MISFVAGYGAAYDPANAAISIAALQAKLTASQTALDGVSTTLAPSKVAINARENAFAGIRKLTTRVVNSFAASGAEKNAVEDAKGFKRKIDGARAKALPTDNPNTPEDESKGGSVSQQSYPQLVEHLDNLIELLNSDSNYGPNETELQVAELQNYSQLPKAANSDVTAANTPHSNARITHDSALYEAGSGLVDLAGLVKKYVKSVYGADSPQYKQISGLEFTRPKS